MDVSVEAGPAYAIAYCHLAAGEVVHIESGAMAAMSDGVNVSATAGPGGIVRGVLRKTLGGESFFMGKYSAGVHGAWVAVSPKYPGDITVLDLEQTGPLTAEAGSLVACEGTVQVDVRVSGAPTAIATRELTLLHLAGRGKVLLSSYGAVQALDVAAGQSLTVDTGHVVAFSHGMKMRVAPLSGAVTAMTTGEGLVAQLRGPGRVLFQTRSESQLRQWLIPPS